MSIKDLSEKEILELQYSLLEEMKTLNSNTKSLDLVGAPTNNMDVNNYPVKRSSSEYGKYRERVLKRDRVCQCCGSSEDLEVHHLLAFHKYNSLRADPDNGIVLCNDCHGEYHSKYGYKKDVNPITLIQFLRDNAKQFQNKLGNEDPEDYINEVDVLNGNYLREKRVAQLKEANIDINDIPRLTTRQIDILCKIILTFDGFCSSIQLSNVMGCPWNSISEDFSVLQNRGLVYIPSPGMIKTTI